MWAKIKMLDLTRLGYIMRVSTNNYREQLWRHLNLTSGYQADHIFLETLKVDYIQCVSTPGEVQVSIISTRTCRFDLHLWPEFMIPFAQKPQ